MRIILHGDRNLDGMLEAAKSALERPPEKRPEGGRLGIVIHGWHGGSFSITFNKDGGVTVRNND